MTNEHKTFSELLRASFKSDDTEEWLDVHFTRPIGLAFALFWNRFGVHPNVITIISFFLGAAAGVMFYFPDLYHNIAGVILLMFANFCDSTDGQMARLTGKKTLVGRVLDGLSGDVWFLFIYVAIFLRTGNMFYDEIGYSAYFIAFAIAAWAGFGCHSRQSSLADYYRQIHLFFLLGKEGSELDNSAEQRKIAESMPKERWFARLFYSNYAGYCKSQEDRTPKFQTFYEQLRQRYSNPATIPQSLRDEFRRGSLPLMKYTNLLTFNSRAIIVYLSCLLGVPYVYPILEITAYTMMYAHMRRSHERLSEQMTKRLASFQ